MAIWFYEKTRLKRSLRQTFSMVLLIALLCAFSGFFEGFIRQKEFDMDAAYDRVPVTVQVSNLTGTQTDRLEIADYVIGYFLSEHYAYGGEAQERAFSSYVKDVNLKATVYYSSESEFTEQQRFSGLTSVDAAEELSELSTTVTYFSGYDKGMFSSSEPVCMVPQTILDELTPDADGGYRLSLSFQMSPAGAAEATEEEEFTVVATYSSDSETIYCPWDCIAAIQMKLDGMVTGDSLSATVRDNHELDEFRQLLSRHFAEVDPSGHHKEMLDSPVLLYFPFAITVHDETLRDTLNSLNQNLQTLYRLRPVFAVTEVVISLAAGFFYIHARRRELAIARSLGTRRSETLGIVLLETTLLCAAGTAFGVAGTALLHSAAIQPWIIGTFLAAVEIGAVSACLTAAGRNGTRILREDE